MKKNYTVTLLVLFGIFALLTYMGISRKSNSVKANQNREHDAVMALDFNVDYPVSPDKVLESYNIIEKYLSGNVSKKATEDDIKAIIEKQRLLFADEFLAQNSFDASMKGYAEKSEYLEEKQARIVQIISETPVFSEDAKKCTITCRQIWTKYIRINVVYSFVKEDNTGKWKIDGWRAQQVE